MPEEKPPVTKETAPAYLDHVGEVLKNAKSPAEYRALIHRFADKVVGEETIQIHLIANYGGGVRITLVELGRTELYQKYSQPYSGSSCGSARFQ